MPRFVQELSDPEVTEIVNSGQIAVPLLENGIPAVKVYLNRGADDEGSPPVRRHL